MVPWPNFFIVGAPKAGTTSLYEYLNNIPGIFMSEEKEPYFFRTKKVSDLTTIKKKIEYLSLFEKKEDYLSLFEKVKNEKIIGEGSTQYLSDPDSSNLIHQTVPHAKILISLRDPVERAFSHYLMIRNRNFITISFHEQLQKEINQNVEISTPRIRLEAGLYFEDVKRFLSTFGKNQVKIIIFEEFVENKKNTLEEIFMFLGLKSKVTKLDDKIHNPYSPPKGPISKRLRQSNTIFQISKKIMSRSTRKSIIDKFLIGERVKPKMDAQDRDLLIKYYKSDVKNLQELLGHKLPWPNFN